MIQAIFQATFSLFFYLLYPLFKNAVLFTYVMIFLSVSAAIFFMAKFLRKISKTKSPKKWMLRLMYVGVGYLIVFIIWFVFVHFPTYKVFNP